MRSFTWCSVLLLISAFACAQTTVPSLMPLPASVHMEDGWFVVDGTFGISFSAYREARLDRAADRAIETLRRNTGIAIGRYGQVQQAKFIVECKGKSQPIQELGEDESYKLQVKPNEVRLIAANPLGVLRGLQTFLQLVQPGQQGFSAPALTIEDRPRFPWRGLLIDVGRHFMPVEVLKRNLDGMEAVKMNVFHWHLSEDQGFRVESKKYPKLQQLSSDGMYYSQGEVKELIEYARDRGIRVVPEFDMPGHSTSWFVAYPELASAPGPYTIERKWGIFDPAMDPTEDHTYSFLDGFIEEMAGLFVDQYFHIGGDEVNGKQWDANANIQQFMHAHGLKDNHDLQAQFNKRLQQLVKKHKKTMEGWDEILHPDLPQDTVVQSWRGPKSLAAGARLGYSGLLSAGYYLDLMHPASAHYAVDPMEGHTASLSAKEKEHILGGEACMWAEYITPENIDERIWPRNAAIAERLWSPQEVKDVDSMYLRLAKVSDELEWLGLKHRSAYRQMLERLAGSSDVGAVRVLADVLEPVKEYQRGQSREYTSATPLNRMVDTVRPESDAGREFSRLADRIIAHAATPDEIEQARAQLMQWKDNDRQFQSVVQHSPLLLEVQPISRQLSTIAEIGLKALDGFTGNTKAQITDQDLGVIVNAKKPQAELLNMAVTAIEKLALAGRR